MLLTLCVKYVYNRLRFKVVIYKSCRGAVFPDTVYTSNKRVKRSICERSSEE